MSDGRVDLGDLVRDPITGFEGVVSSRTEFLYGCVRCGVTSQTLDKDGKEQILSFDEAGLQIVEVGKFKLKPSNVSTRPPGGPERRIDNLPEAPARR